MHGKKRALIVDDDRMVRRLLEDALHHTHECSVVCDGKEGFRLATEAGLYDIVTMDLAMPGWDGMSALALIETMNPNCRIIVISGLIEPEDEEQLQHFQCVRKVMTKPFDPRTLLEAVAAVEAAME